MKKILILALGAVAVVACKQQGPKTEDLIAEPYYPTERQRD